MHVAGEKGIFRKRGQDDFCYPPNPTHTHKHFKSLDLEHIRIQKVQIREKVTHKRK